MYTKRFLIIIKQLYLNFRNLKGFYYVPLVFLYVILSVLNIATIKEYGFNENAFTIICNDIQKFVPIMCSWWIIFALKEYIEGDGCEVLHLYKNSLALDVIMIYIWYLIHVAILMIIYSFFLTNLSLEFIRIAAQSLFYASAAYFFIFLFKSIPITFMLIFMYEIICLFTNLGIKKYISIFYIYRAINIRLIAIENIPVIIICSIFLFLGNRFHKFYFE